MNDALMTVIDAGGTLALAAFSIWMLNLAWKARIDAEVCNATTLREMWTLTNQALRDNTAAITRLCERLGDRDS